MEFKYKLTKEGYTKIISDINKHSNIFFVIIFSLCFFIRIRDLILDNTLLVFIIYMMSVFVMFLFFRGVDALTTNLMVKINEKKLNIKYGTYTCRIDEEKISNTIDNYEQEIYFNDIKKVIYKKDVIYVFPKSKKIVLCFNKILFENSCQFDKLERILKERVIITK